MAQVTKETMIGDLLNINLDAAAPVLLGIGMHCLGCPASQMETIEQAAAVRKSARRTISPLLMRE